MFEDDLRRLDEAGLGRTVRDRSTPQGARCRLGGEEVVNFGSNDYLGLAADERLAAAATEALAKEGTGAGASRLLGGGSAAHAGLEARLARLKATPRALLFNSGYALNTGAIPALAGAGDEIFSDELNHASLIDGCRLSRASTHVYRHCDVEHLKGLLAQSTARRKWVVTDTVFSMGGDLAPLPELFELCEAHGAALYLDDAHATGVLGGGAGSLAHFSLSHKPWVVQMGTLSKALGAFGAFVAAGQDVTDWLINNARSLIFSTALPPSILAAAAAAVDIVQTDKTLVQRLWANRRELAEGLEKIPGLATGNSVTPIIPLAMKDNQHAMDVCARLLALGIYAPAIRPPAVPTAIIRLTVTAGHTGQDIGQLLDALPQAL